MKAASVAILVVYAIVVSVLTWPLLADLPGHVADPAPIARADVDYALWALAWQTHAFATAPALVLQANVYHPAPDALAYGPAGLGVLPWFAAARAVTGSAAAGINVVLLVGLFVGAVGLHYAAWRTTGWWGAGLVAASSWLASPAASWRLAAAPTYAAVGWVGWLLLEAGGRARVVVLVPLAIAASLADLVYVAPGVLGGLGLAGLGCWAVRPTRAAGRRMLIATMLAAGALVPLYLPYAHVAAANPGLAAQSVWNGARPAPVAFAVLGPLALPLVSLVLACASVFAPSRRWWVAVAFVGIWCAAGPLLPVVLPLARGAPRIGFPGSMALALLAGIGASAICTWLSDPDRGGLPPRATRAVGVAIVVLLLVLDLRGSRPDGFAVRPVEGPPAYASWLAQGTGPVLELPIGGGAGTTPGFHTRAMVASTHHWRPIVNGYASYWPAGFPERMRLANALPDPNVLAELRGATGLTSIVVHLDAIWPVLRAPWLAVAATPRRDLVLAYRDADTLGFEVTPPAPGVRP